MKKFMGVFISLAFVLLLAGCGSSPRAPAIEVNWDGFWVFEEGDIMYVKNDVFVLFSQGGIIQYDGLFHYNDARSQFRWGLVGSGYVIFNYTVKSESEIVVRSEKASWANGTWRKSKEPLFKSDNPLVGYWYDKLDEKRKFVVLILPSGEGFWYNVENDIHLTGRRLIEYDDKNPFQFSFVRKEETRETVLSYAEGYTYSFSVDKDGNEILLYNRAVNPFREPGLLYKSK